MYTFKIIKNKKGEFRVQFCFRKEVIFWTESYTRKPSAKNAIESIIKNAAKALVEENPKSEGVKKGTIYEDLKDIEYRIYKIEIEKIKDGRTSYLRYANPLDSINKQLLNETEAFAMEGAIEVDFSAVTDVDTAAISLMLEWQRRATASDCTIKFTHLPVDLISLATLYQVNDFIAISAD